jgi:hypothetical protein
MTPKVHTHRQLLSDREYVRTMGLEELVTTLYSEKPNCILYHYTSLDGLLKIVQNRTIRATDSRYFSDFAEMSHAVELIRTVIGHELTLQRLPSDEVSMRFFNQFIQWMNDHMNYGHGPYVACFTAQGNLLSQWRGYTPPARGISLGFDPGALCGIVEGQRPAFMMAKCIYELERKQDIAKAIILAVLELARAKGEVGAPIWSFYHVFDSVQLDLLRVMALLKDGSFREEEEWRAVCAMHINTGVPIEFREGTSTLVPFINFGLSTESGRGLVRVIVGPTPHVIQSVNATKAFLSQLDALPDHSVSYCEIPYRTW